MSQLYKIKQGDYLAKIALKFHFANYNTIWNDPHNADLKQKRKSPNILFPGDNLFIPDIKGRQESRATSRLHSFVVPSGRVLIQIVLNDTDFEPIANADYVLNFTDKSVAASADGDGLIQQDVDITRSEVGTLIIGQTDNVFDVKLGIRLGHLNPLDTPSGQMARLNNLGYFAGKLATGDLMDQKKMIPAAEQARFRSAVEEFQCDHMEPGSVDGKCGPRTQASLKKVYGS